MLRRILLPAALLVALLLPAPANATFPGPNGRILYASGAEASTIVTYSSVLPSGRGATTVFTRGRGRTLEGVRFSPNGRSLLFDETIDGDVLRSNIVRMSAFGRGRTVVQTGTSSGSMPRYGTWAATGAIFHVRSVTNDTRLVGPAGPIARMYDSTETGCSCPKRFAPSPDGSRIVYVKEVVAIDPVTLDRADSEELWIVNADGTGDTRLTSFGDLSGPGAGFTELRWGRGGYIYFNAFPPGSDGSSGVDYWYRIRPDGTDLARVAPDLSVATIDVSPDGRWLLLTLDSNRVYRSDRSGRGRLLVPGDAAVFSPDSRRIAYAGLVRLGTFRFQTDVYTMATNGTDRRRLTRTSTISERPIDWQRVPR